MALNITFALYSNELHFEFSGHIVETIQQFNNLSFYLFA